ncbi:MAG: DUF2497 domain-containing protein [Caulobacteraceae bacterium]
MADQTAPEPTMEEILASIRRIISDDDAPAPPPEAAGEANWTPPLTAELEGGEDDDVLDLNEPALGSPASEGQERSVSSGSPPLTQTAAPKETLVEGKVAEIAASSFSRLSAAAARPPSLAMPSPGRTLEDVTRELLRPMLKAWLDENLGAIVQQRVDEEVERIARGRVR